MSFHRVRPRTGTLTVLACTVLACTALTATSHPASAAESRVTVARSAALATGDHSTGPATATLPLTVELTLRSKDPAGLAATARAVSTPKTASYRHYLSHGEFTRRFGASASSVRTVEGYLHQAGFSHSTVTADGLAIKARGTVAAAQRAFATAVSAVATTTGTALANTAPATLPSSVAASVVGLSGLSTLPAAKPLYAAPHAATPRPANRAAAPVVGPGPQPCAALSALHSSVQGPYTTGDLASAEHVVMPRAAGAGQGIALFELSSYTDADMAGYDRCYGITPHRQLINVDGGTHDMSGNIEVLLDEEIVSSAAPKSLISIYVGPNTNQGYLDTFRQIAIDNTSQSVSVSWGACEATFDPGLLAAENQIFSEMAIQGQSIFVASGDSGSAGCANYGDTTVQPSDPGAQPYVTSVGGTGLYNTTCRRTDPNCEVVWNSWGAGAGGASSIWPAPSYQSHIGATTRQYPDIAAPADPYTGYLIYDATDFRPYYNSPWGVIGGTSAAAPLEAAFTALSNQRYGIRAGFMNPALYAAGEAATASASSFRDITVGTNDCFNNGFFYYNARPGFDMASGWGSPQWDILGPALAADTAAPQ